ncbi:energy-coupling factor transporter ATPase [Fredinandcohnia sp. 179-A 10B2 NHS]|uniref:energy-coupling factor transporter ATPase n=1 Tax=Fredinandcohnia sp. 179-A 10B2 NHS TaxID=3235176 RepID=UPI0039A2B262
MQINFENVTADYQLGPIRSPLVLQSVDLLIKSGLITAVVGHTGAGKSSLLKTMNGLILPVKGRVKIGEAIIEAGKTNSSLKDVRKKVGMVFQFPESQLFAETVEKDICFGPMNFGVPVEEAKEIARSVIEQVGLGHEVLSKSPFSLSGGQKRRVAIAGILAMEPDVLILDEPGAGLDPKGKRDILSLISAWNRERSLTTVIVTHDMDDVAMYAHEVVLMERGRVVLHEEKRRFFSNHKRLEQLHIDAPEARRFQLKIEQETGIKFPGVCLTVEELVDCLIEVGLV